MAAKFWRRPVMADDAGKEFWRGLKPIEKVFKPHSMPDQYLSNVADDDDKMYVPFTETVSSRPLWISPSANSWCDILMCKGPGLVNRHYHPHEVLAYTVSGKWGYLEHDWVATAGDFIYESPGEGHTLVSYEHPDPMKVFFVVRGPLIWLDEDGNSAGHFDVHDYIDLCKKHYESIGMPDHVEKLFR
jgi:2,4'-dihydroxyacetophenone dioxygenase